jgi:phosphate starvation-inducible PhoH-like protein
VLRGLQLVIQGRPSQLERASALVELLRPLWQDGQAIGAVDLQTALTALDTGRTGEHRELSQQVLARSQSGKLLRPRTVRQKAYVEAMERHDLTLALGPAGTGKTFLATVQAVRMLQERRVERLILTRPAVEAGERLGFLPGDLQQKVDPYLRPLYDALHGLLGTERTNALLEKGVIEVAPLAYMRGRTLADAFVILDEAQNTTTAQMRMVLTRLGENSRMVVTGDPTQSDLPREQLSGLVEAAEVLTGVEGVAICHLSAADVVRHPLVQRLVHAYARRDGAKAPRPSGLRPSGTHPA